MESIGLDFTTTEETFGAVKTIPLVPDGESKEVDGSNRLEYVQLMLKQLVLNNSRDQLASFLNGFYEVGISTVRSAVLCDCYVSP